MKIEGKALHDISNPIQRELCGLLYPGEHTDEECWRCEGIYDDYLHPLWFHGLTVGSWGYRIAVEEAAKRISEELDPKRLSHRARRAMEDDSIEIVGGDDNDAERGLTLEALGKAFGDLIDKGALLIDCRHADERHDGDRDEDDRGDFDCGSCHAHLPREGMSHEEGFEYELHSNHRPDCTVLTIAKLFVGLDKRLP